MPTRRAWLQASAAPAVVRAFGGAAALACAAAPATAAAGSATSSATASAIVAEHAEMAAVVDADAAVERVYSGGRWCEGPAWSARRAALVFSDVRRNRILLLGAHGDAQAIRTPSRFANGNAFDADGRLVSCEHGGRRVVREDTDGRITVLADRFAGRALNSPNDLAIAADGAVWFTDPTFGLTMPEEGRTAPPEQRGRFVFRLDADGRLDVVADSFEQPNGIAFSPDQRVLYVSDTSGGDGHEGRREIRAFDVQDGRRLHGERVFARLDSGVPDGLDVDAAGRVYAACGDGVRVWRGDGLPLGRIAMPSTCGNLAFGGADRKRLYVCTGETIHAVALNVAGANRLA